MPEGVHWADWQIPETPAEGDWRALRNGDVAAFAWAEHAFMAGHGIDLSKTQPIHRFA